VKGLIRLDKKEITTRGWKDCRNAFGASCWGRSDANVTRTASSRWFRLREGDATAKIWLYVDDFCFGVEEILAGENLDEHQSVLWERIHHVQVASVKA